MSRETAEGALMRLGAHGSFCALCVRMAESGSREKLLAFGGTYAELFRLQSVHYR